MPTDTQTVPASKGMTWTGRIISGLVVLFMLFDGITKVIKVPQVMEVAAKMGFSVNSIVGIGAVLLACTAIYIIPRTSILGAIRLTGYLGGAVATHVHAGDPVFEMLFPVIFGVLAWGGLFFRDERVRSLIPVRR